MLKVFTSFSGYDSQCMALDLLKAERSDFDYELVGWCDIDKRAIAAHDAVYPQYASINYKDIKKIDWNKVPDFDFFTYSSPCFPAGTKITTKRGLVPIEEVSKDDVVLTHTETWKPVIETMRHAYVGTMYTVSSMGAEVVCTKDHPFYVKDKKTGDVSFIEAEYLDPAFYLVALNATQDEFPGEMDFYPFSITFESAVSFVYNLEVEEDHSYVANFFVVHNCQDFSNAGLQRGGTEGSGTRSSLLWECRKAIETKRPKYCILENVYALASKKFLPLLFKWVQVLEELGYHSYCKVLNSKNFGVPQSRDRLYLVSIRDDVDFNFSFPLAQPLHKNVMDLLDDRDFSLSSINSSKHLASFEERREVLCDDLDFDLSKSLVQLGRLSDLKFYQTSRVFDPHYISPTLCTNCISGHSPIFKLDDTFFLLNGREALRLMGVSEDNIQKIASVLNDISMGFVAGNSIVVNVLHNVFRNLLVNEH